MQKIYFLIEKPVGHVSVHKPKKDNGKSLDVDRFLLFCLSNTVIIIYFYTYVSLIIFVYFSISNQKVKNNDIFFTLFKLLFFQNT